MSYFVTPRRFNLLATRCKPHDWDRIGLVAEIRSMKFDDPSAGGRLWDTRAAYLHFMGAGQSKDLTDDLWGLQGGWRMPVPGQDQLEENEELYLGITVTNFRHYPDDRWREYLLKVSSIGASIALGRAIDIPGEVVAAAKELGISESVLEIAKQLGFSGILNAGEEWISGLFASAPQCAGLVFHAQYPINPDRLDKLHFAEGGGISGALETVRKRQTLSAQSAIAIPAGCNSPNGTVEFEIERETTLYFPQTRLHSHARIAGFIGDASAVPTGLLVDERSVLDPSNRVRVTIERRAQDFSDTFDVTVRDYEDNFQQFFTATFSGATFDVVAEDMPSAKNLFAARTTAFHPPERMPIGDFPRERTLTARMTAPDGTYCELSLWRTSTKNDAGEIVQTINQLRFTRRGTTGFTNTFAWLAPPSPVT